MVVHKKSPSPMKREGARRGILIPYLLSLTPVFNTPGVILEDPAELTENACLAMSNANFAGLAPR